MRDSETFSTSAMQLGVEVAGLGLGKVDYVADTVTLDDRAATLFDLPPNQPISRRDLHARIHPDDWPQIEEQLTCLLSPREVDVIDVVHRVRHDDGNVMWLSARKRIEFGADGAPASGMVAIMDVSNVKEAEAQIRVLMGELNHRMKNLLTVVGSIARMIARSGPQEDFVDRFVTRLRSMSRNQDLLVRQNWTRAALQELVETQLSSMIGGASRLQCDGPVIWLKSDAVQFLGLALHELTVNALKYGALSGDDGEVCVGWSLSDGPELEFSMSWRESGGPDVKPPPRSGFGQDVLVRTTEAALGGSVDLEYRPEGLLWQLRCPADRILASAPAR